MKLTYKSGLRDGIPSSSQTPLCSIPLTANLRPLRCSSSRLETRFGLLWSPLGFRAAPRFLFLRRKFSLIEAFALC